MNLARQREIRVKVKVPKLDFLLGKFRHKPLETTETEETTDFSLRYPRCQNRIKVINDLLTIENPKVVRERCEDTLGPKRDIRWRDMQLQYDDSMWHTTLFRIPVSHLTSVEAWIHEFSEYSVDKQIVDADDLLADSTMKISFNGVTEVRDVAHILVSLHCISGFDGKMISPEEFEQVLGWRK